MWFDEAVLYQIYPLGLCGAPEYNDGVTVPRIRSLLPWAEHIRKLGADTVLLNPVFDSDKHGYDTRDYNRVDCRLGTNEDLKQVCDAFHAAGIRVMLDAVFNHCGPAFAPWRDVVVHGPASPYWDWFFVRQWPFDEGETRDGRYFSFAFHGGMPKLNTNNPAVIAYFSGLCAQWVRDYGVDGLRFDVGNEVSHRFLKAVRQAVTAVRPDVYLLGEIWHDASPWLEGDEYDSVMNYPLQMAVTRFFTDQNRPAQQLVWDLRRCMTMYRAQTVPALFNLLDSHDTDRIWNRTPEVDAFLQQIALLLLLPALLT